MALQTTLRRGTISLKTETGAEDGGEDMATFEITTASGIVVSVTRKRVKNFNLRVRRDGTVSLSIPVRASRAAAHRFLDERADWIARHVARQHERARREASAPAIPERIPLWGQLVPLAEALGTPANHLSVADDAPVATASTAAASADKSVCPADAQASSAQSAAASPAAANAAARAIDALYRRETQRALASIVPDIERHVGVSARSWQIRRMKTRWGSCTPARAAIRINSALAAYPPACLAYVVTHELVHLIEPSHNARFHTLLDRFYPDNRACAALLKRSAGEVAEGLS